MPDPVSTQLAAAVLQRAPRLVESVAELIRENDLTFHGASLREAPGVSTLDRFVLVGAWSCGCQAAKIHAHEPREVLELCEQLRQAADTLEARALLFLGGCPQPGQEIPQ